MGRPYSSRMWSLDFVLKVVGTLIRDTLDEALIGIRGKGGRVGGEGSGKWREGSPPPLMATHRLQI